MTRPTDNAARLLLRPQEAADTLGVSLRCLMDWTKAGEIPHTRLGERCLRFPMDGLRQWVASRTTWPTAVVTIEPEQNVGAASGNANGRMKSREHG